LVNSYDQDPKAIGELIEKLHKEHHNAFEMFPSHALDKAIDHIKMKEKKTYSIAWHGRRVQQKIFEVMKLDKDQEENLKVYKYEK
jgi:hypothetical protein